MRTKHTAIAILAVLFLQLQPLTAVFAFAALAKPLTPGGHTITLQHSGLERNAIVHIPPRAGEKRDLPVVLNFHGGGGHSANEQEYSLMDSLADRELFVVVYPNGTGRFPSGCLLGTRGPAAAMPRSTTSTMSALPEP